MGTGEEEAFLEERRSASGGKKLILFRSGGRIYPGGGGTFWNVDKYIGTVGEATNEKVVKRYIGNQSIDKSESEIPIKQLKLLKI